MASHVVFWSGKHEREDLMEVHGSADPTCVVAEKLMKVRTARRGNPVENERSITEMRYRYLQPREQSVQTYPSGSDLGMVKSRLSFGSELSVVQSVLGLRSIIAIADQNQPAELMAFLRS